MSIIEASITINIPDGVDPSEFLQMIDSVISSSTGNDSELHVTEMDNPLTTSPIGPR